MVGNKTPSGLMVDVKIKMIKASAGMKVFPVEKARCFPVSKFVRELVELPDCACFCGLSTQLWGREGDC